MNAQGNSADLVERTGHLTLAQGVALYVGAVLGTGLLALPSMAARAAGPASLIAWLALVVVSIPVAATFAALGGRYPDAGGPATFARRAFGAQASAVTGWWFYFGALAGMPAASSFGSAYVTEVVGGGQVMTVIGAAALVVITVLINFFGVRVSGKAQLVFAGVLLTLLVTAIVASVPHLNPANLHPFAPRGLGGLAVAMSLLVWAFIGWETVSHLAADFRRPRRDLPRATGIALMIIGMLYLAVAAVTILALGSSVGETDAPLALLLSRSAGASVKIVTAFIAVVITLGVLNAFVASLSKLGAALGRDGALPAWLAAGSEAGEIPRRSLLVVTIGTAISFAVAITIGFRVEPLLLAENACLIAIYTMAMAAATRLLPAHTIGWWFAGIALILVTGVLLLTKLYLLTPLVLGSGAIVYLWLHHWRRNDSAGPAHRSRYGYERDTTGTQS